MLRRPDGEMISTGSAALLNVARSIHTLVFGLFFVGIVGLGATAGILAVAAHSAGTLGKLLAEAKKLAEQLHLGAEAGAAGILDAEVNQKLLAGVDPRVAQIAATMRAFQASGTAYDASELMYEAALAAAPLKGMFSARTALTFEEELAASAKQALTKVGPGKGPVYGTKLHTEFGNINKAKGLVKEQSYLNGEPVKYGTKGSIRVDAIKDTAENPGAVGDLKPAGTLTQQRIDEIRSHLPVGSQDIDIFEVPY